MKPIHGQGNNRAIREVNRSIILDLVRRGEHISRTELARRSKLTKPTVSTIIEQLIKDDIVHEVGLGESLSGGGRPARLLEFNDASAAFLGIHFAVGSTVVALADARGVIRQVKSKPMVKESPAKAVKALRPLLNEVLQAAKISRGRLEAACAVLPGLVDQESGVCTLAPNLGWRDFPLRDALAEELHVPVSVNNITQASAVAEGRVGVARGMRSYVWLYVGSGVGAGIVLDGRLFFGQRGFSGELGHCPVAEDGPVCGCGRRGCLETVTSTMALDRMVKQALSSKVKSLLSKATGPIDVAMVSSAAQAGDAVASRILADIGEHLGRGISYLLNILNPEMIVLGGAMADAGETLLREVRGSVARHALLPHGVAIVPSTLGDKAELTGAVLLALERTARSYRIVGSPGHDLPTT
jgi:predicted NBD/HSP70 family sugar kinase